MQDRPTNSRAALLMMASMLAFALGDTFIKATNGDLPLSQLLVLRGVLATAFIAALAYRLGQWRLPMARRDAAMVCLRSLAEMGAAYFFLTALFFMPLANATAVLQVLPLTVTLGAALFLREQVGWRRWAAIGVGFAGMLMIVKPGTEGFNVYSLYAVGAVVCVTVRDLSIRGMTLAVPSLMVTFWASLGVLAFAVVWSAGQDWVVLTPRLGWLVLGSTACIICAYSLSVLVMRAGAASFTAPFRYTGLLFALILGFLAFGDWPDAVTLAGAALVVASGVFTILRERQLKTRTT